MTAGGRRPAIATSRRPCRAGLDGAQPPPRHLEPAGAALAAVADPDAAALDSRVERRGAPGFADPLAMIDEAELDAVVIAAPTTAHVPLALAAIERGIPVLVEKPLAATVDDGIDRGRRRAPRASGSRSAMSSATTRPCWRWAACCARAGYRRSTRSSAAGRARSRPASATSA